MIDQKLAGLRTHRTNIQRYRNLLQTSLTDLEHQFVQKRLTEEQSNLESLANPFPMTFAGQRRTVLVWPSKGPGLFSTETALVPGCVAPGPFFLSPCAPRLGRKSLYREKVATGDTHASQG